MPTSTYESLFLLGTAATADVDGAVKQVQTMIEKHGGTIVLIRKWDEKRLAYEIKKNKRGLYVLAFYSGPGASVAGITRDVNLSETVLRVLITDANHLSLSEMKAMEPQQPVKETRREETIFVPAEASAI